MEFTASALLDTADFFTGSARWHIDEVGDPTRYEHHVEASRLCKQAMDSTRVACPLFTLRTLVARYVQGGGGTGFSGSEIKMLFSYECASSPPPSSPSSPSSPPPSP